MELRRQNVSDLSSVIAAADGLANFNVMTNDENVREPKDKGEMKKKKRFGRGKLKLAVGEGKSNTRAKIKSSNSNLR